MFRSIPHMIVKENALLSQYTRFGIGGPAAIYAETPCEGAFVEALRVARSSGRPWAVIGDGTNLIVSDDGFRGIVLRFTGSAIAADGNRVHAEAGASLQT